ncbi:hypothetical protein YYC_01716 [Plasmodium yoelii 17X]|uniref:Uncharacterized protein n=1 Tax=Plasmodium yoelii 17X TaxID=1323249 RepID=V7PSA8_PLAYE|nr:hypothetical protein YYC_01716 [Plasmodium yoelii 17X]
MEKGKLVGILERELKEYGDKDILMLFHQFYQSIEENDYDNAQDSFNEMVRQMKKFYVVYDKRNKNDLIGKIKNYFKEETTEVNIVDVSQEKIEEQLNKTIEEYDNFSKNLDDIKNGELKEYVEKNEFPRFKTPSSFLNTNLFDDINLDDLEKCEFSFDIIDLYDKSYIETVDEMSDTVINDDDFYETFEYFINLLCLLYFLKNIYFDLSYRSNENSYSFLFKGFEERKNKIISYFFIFKRLKMYKLMDNEVIKIFCNFFQYTYINDYLIRNIFDNSTSMFIFTAVNNFNNKYEQDNISLSPNNTNVNAQFGNNDKTGNSISSGDQLFFENNNIQYDIEKRERQTNGGYNDNNMEEKDLLKKNENDNQEDYLNKKLNNFFISNQTPNNKSDKNSFVEIIYNDEVIDNMYSDKIINSLFYFFNNPYLIFTFQKNVLYYIEKKNKDNEFFSSHKNSQSLIRYLNHCVTTISEILHIFITSGLFFNNNIMQQKTNKYLNFYKLLNFNNMDFDYDIINENKSKNIHDRTNDSNISNTKKNTNLVNKHKTVSKSRGKGGEKTKKDSKHYHKHHEKRKRAISDGTIVSDIDNNKLDFGKSNKTTNLDKSKKYNYTNTTENKKDIDDINMQDFNITKYLNKYKTVLRKLCENDFNKNDTTSNDDEEQIDTENYYDERRNDKNLKNINNKNGNAYLRNNYNRNSMSYNTDTYDSDVERESASYSSGSKEGYYNSKHQNEYNKPRGYNNNSDSNSVEDSNSRYESEDSETSYRNTLDRGKYKNAKKEKNNSKKSTIDNNSTTIGNVYNSMYKTDDISNKKIFNEILNKSKKKKKFYEIIRNVNKLKNAFDVSNIQKNKNIDLNYVENIDTISYFISIFNSDNIFQFDYYFLKFIAEITTSYNNYIKKHIVDDNSVKNYGNDIDKLANEIKQYLNEVTKLIYVYTWCILYIFGHSYSYVKYAKYFYQKKSFFILENKKQCIFNNFNYCIQENGYKNGSGEGYTQETDQQSDAFYLQEAEDDVHLKNFFNPLNVVENLKYNYEIRRNVNEFNNFNFHNFINVYKNSYFQNIVDKLQLNIKFIENILFTIDNVFDNKINKSKKKKKYINYLCVKNQKLDDIYNSIENLKKNINKYKKTFHYCLNFNNIKNAIILSLEEMNMTSDKLELNKLLNEQLNKIENRGQLKRRKKKINVKLIDNNFVLDTHSKKKRKKMHRSKLSDYSSYADKMMEDDISSSYSEDSSNNSDEKNKMMQYTFGAKTKKERRKRESNRSYSKHSDTSSLLQNEHSRKNIDNKNSFEMHNHESSGSNYKNSKKGKIDHDSKEFSKNNRKGKHDYLGEIEDINKMYESSSNSNKYDCKSDTLSIDSSLSSNISSGDSNNRNYHHKQTNKKKISNDRYNNNIYNGNVNDKNNINNIEEKENNIVLNSEYNTERLIFFFNLFNGNELFYYLSLYYLIKDEKIMEILHLLPLKYLLDLLILYDLTDYIKFKVIARVFRIIYEFQDFSPILNESIFFNTNYFFLNNANFTNYEFLCKFLTINNLDIYKIEKKTIDESNYKVISTNNKKLNNLIDNDICIENENDITADENINDAYKNEKKPLKEVFLDLIKNMFSLCNFSTNIKSYPIVLKNLLNKILISIIGKYSYISNDKNNKDYNSITYYILRFIFKNFKNITLGYSNSSYFNYTITDPIELYNISMHNFILYHIYELAIKTKVLSIKSSCFKILKYLLTEYYYYPDLFNEKSHELINSEIKINNFYIKNVILDFVSFNIMVCHLQKELTSNNSVLNNLDLFNYSIKSIANYLIEYNDKSFYVLMDKNVLKTFLIKLTFMMPFIYKLKIPACVIRLYIRVIKSLDKDILDNIHSGNKINLIYDSLFYIIVSRFIYFFLNINIELDEEATNILSSNQKNQFSRNSFDNTSYIKINTVDNEKSENYNEEERGNFRDEYNKNTQSVKQTYDYLTLNHNYNDYSQNEELDRIIEDIKSSNKHEVSEEAVNSDEKVVNRDEENINRDEKVMNRDEENINSDEKVVNGEDENINRDEKVMNRDEENINRDEKVMNEEENINSDKKVMNGEDENMNSDKKVMNEEENMNSDKKVMNEEENMNSDKKVMNEEEENMNNDKKVMNGEDENINRNENSPNDNENAMNVGDKEANGENEMKEDTVINDMDGRHSDDTSKRDIQNESKGDSDNENKRNSMSDDTSYSDNEHKRDSLSGDKSYSDNESKSDSDGSRSEYNRSSDVSHSEYNRSSDESRSEYNRSSDDSPLEMDAGVNANIDTNNVNKISDVLFLRKVINENNNLNLDNNYFINYSLHILHKENYSIYVFFSTFFKNALKEYCEISKKHKI